MLSINDISKSERAEVNSASEIQSEPFRQLIRKEKHNIIREAMEELLPRDAEVIRRRYGIDCPEQTLEEVGQDLGVTRERIRQIQARAEERLKDLLLKFNFFPFECNEPLSPEETASQDEPSEQTEIQSG